MKLPPVIMTAEEIEQAEEECTDRLRDQLAELEKKPETPAKPSPNADILDIRQAASVLGISAKWLYRNYKNIPHVLIPAGKKPRIKFRRRDLEDWLTRHTVDWRKP